MKKKDVKIKKLKGTNRPDKEVKPINYPKLNSIETPESLINDFAVNEWVKVTSYLNSLGRLCEGHFNGLLMYCNECGIYWQACKELKKGFNWQAKTTGYKQVKTEVAIKNSALANAIKIGALFGLDPLTALKFPNDIEPDEKDDFADL